VVNQV
jgi:hypothetical protein